MTDAKFRVTTGCDTPAKEFEDEESAKDGQSTHQVLCDECEDSDVVLEQINEPEQDPAKSNGESVQGPPEVVESEREPIESETVDAEPVETQETGVVDPEQLSKDPIGFLRSVNTDFVHTIKGTPAIFKKGFRFIQREFEISTQSEVVELIEDPLGVVVWAKAELPDGYSAEAHGEGYKFETDVSDNEFVRMADSRAKNRALSDLTAAGALAVEELQGSE